MKLFQLIIISSFVFSLYMIGLMHHDFHGHIRINDAISTTRMDGNDLVPHTENDAAAIPKNSGFQEYVEPQLRLISCL